MAGIRETVFEQFFDRMAKNENIDARIVDGLRSELSASKLPLADKLAALFKTPPEA